MHAIPAWNDKLNAMQTKMMRLEAPGYFILGATEYLAGRDLRKISGTEVGIPEAALQSDIGWENTMTGRIDKKWIQHMTRRDDGKQMPPNA